MPKLDFDLSIYSFNADSTQVQSFKGGMRIGAKAQGEITDDITYYGKMNIFFEEGSHRALNDSSFQTANTYGVEEAYVKYAPIPFANLKIGVSEVSEKSEKLFIDPPGLGAVITVRPLDYSFLEWDFYATYNNISQDNTRTQTGQLSGSSSSYTLVGSKANLILDSVDIKAHLVHYTFNDLTNELAYTSRFRGNSISGSTDINSIFIHDFKGIYMSSAMTLKTFTIKPRLMLEKLVNLENNDEATLIGLGLTSESFDFRVSTFENEADTLPAIVVSPYYGETSRQGQTIGVSYINKSTTFSIDYHYLDAMGSNAYQDDLSIILFELRRRI